ncbi:MAG: VWA domain-containing protein [Planctomycetes bacterium]|nr:VWA domain-containing protein [Planctomycetota bacterium]
MRIAYLDWKEGVRRLAERGALARRVFYFLLVRENGDVEEALRLLRMVGTRHGIFDGEFRFDDFKAELLRDRIVKPGAESGLVLTPRGERLVRGSAFDALFSGLDIARAGDHRTPHEAAHGGEAIAETRPYSFGDEMSDIDFGRSYRNTLRRTAGADLTLAEEDLEVQEREHHASVATVLLLDVSHSMILYGEDRITPAKRVALALAELILTRYPHDALHVVLFGDEAREISVKELTYAAVGPYHTNTHAGLRLARRILLRKKHTNRQIVMITDGKPTALEVRGEIYQNAFGLDRRIVNKTLDEAAECRRHSIPITTFMLAREPMLVRFVEELTRTNRGRALFSSVGDLEHAVVVDFMRNRRARARL